MNSYFHSHPIDLPLTSKKEIKKTSESLEISPSEYLKLKLLRLRREREKQKAIRKNVKHVINNTFKKLEENPSLIPSIKEAQKKYSESKNPANPKFIADPWDSEDERLRKSFNTKNLKPLFEIPFSYKRILSTKNPAERKADQILEASNSGLLTAEEVDKLYKDLVIENARLKRQFRQGLSPTHFTDGISLQSLELSFEDRKAYENENSNPLLSKKKISELLEAFTDKDNAHNLLSRIQWPLSSELPKLAELEQHGILSVHDFYTQRHSKLPEAVKTLLKKIDMTPNLSDVQKHLKARDILSAYQFDIFEDPHAGYRSDYMNYLNARQRLLRERLALPLSGASGMHFQINVTKSDELHDFAKSRGINKAIPSPRYAAKAGSLAFSEFLTVWEKENLDNNVLNKRLFGQFTRESKNKMQLRRMNRRWLKKMIPKTFRVTQIYKYYFRNVIRRMK